MWTVAISLLMQLKRGLLSAPDYHYTWLVTGRFLTGWWPVTASLSVGLVFVTEQQLTPGQ